jgi:hypothetical protein
MHGVVIEFEFEGWVVVPDSDSPDKPVSGHSARRAETLMH